jgi:hypothetical protein
MNDLLKSINSYYDIKDTAKYLIYFTSSSPNHAHEETALTNTNSLSLNITNGLTVWSTLLNQTNLTSLLQKQQLILPVARKSITLSELCENLYQILISEKYELNKVVSTSELAQDLIEFKVTNASFFTLNIVCSPLSSVSGSHEIKNLLFSMHDRLTKLKESEHVTPGNKSTTDNTNASASSGQSLKKFNINSQVGIAGNRKPGMSIINPMSKRRKVPQGVKYDDDQDDEGEESTPPLAEDISSQGSSCSSKN